VYRRIIDKDNNAPSAITVLQDDPLFDGLAEKFDVGRYHSWVVNKPLPRRFIPSDMMVDYISDFMERKKEQPFLVYFPMNLTHCPFVPTPHSKDWNPSDLGSKTYKGNPKYFANMVAYMDFSIGRIVDKIEQLGFCFNIK
jgi:arylsulfatase A-like enzyme